MSAEIPRRVLVVEDTERKHVLGLLADVLRKQGYVVTEARVERMHGFPDMELMVRDALRNEEKP